MKESVYYITIHKCASTLFSSFVLKNINGLNHIDYAKQIYNGKDYNKLDFEKYGFVYGPIRVSANRSSPVYDLLVKKVATKDFLNDKIALFLVRDPRDILVSAYYSFGFTHRLSDVTKIQTHEKKLRQKIQNFSIDEYALESASELEQHFNTIYTLHTSSDRSLILKYEDMINNWDRFSNHLTEFVDIDNEIIDQIYIETRPRPTEKLTSHRRSGSTGQFRKKFKIETLEQINEKFDETLKKFNYSR